MTIRGYLNSILDNKQFAEEFKRLIELSSIIPIEESLAKIMHKDVVESALDGIGKPVQLRTRKNMSDSDEYYLEEGLFVKSTSMFGQPYALIYKDGKIMEVPAEQIIDTN